MARPYFVLGMEYLRNQSICRVQILDYVNTTTNLDDCRHLWAWMGLRNQNMCPVQILDDISINLEDTCWDPSHETCLICVHVGRHGNMPWAKWAGIDAASVLEERQLHMEMELTVFLPKTLLCDSVYQLVVTAQHQQSDAQSHGDAQQVRTDRGIRCSKGNTCYMAWPSWSKEMVRTDGDHSGWGLLHRFTLLYHLIGGSVNPGRRTWKVSPRLEYQIRNYEMRTQPWRYIWSLDLDL